MSFICYLCAMLVKARAIFLLFILTHCSVACTPAKAPTAVDVAATAVALVDRTLAVIIDNLPVTDAGVDPAWDARVATVEKAAKVVKEAGDVCEVLPALEQVSAEIKCTECTAAVQTASKELKCQP